MHVPCKYTSCIYHAVALRCSGFAGKVSKADLLGLGITPGCQFIQQLHHVGRQVGDEWLQTVPDGEFVLSDSCVPVCARPHSAPPETLHSSSLPTQITQAMSGDTRVCSSVHGDCTSRCPDGAKAPPPPGFLRACQMICKAACPPVSDPKTCMCAVYQHGDCL